MVKKKVMWACKTILPAQKRKKRKHVRERESVETKCFYTSRQQAQNHVSQMTTKAKWTECRPYHNKPTNELFIYGRITPRTKRLSPSSESLLHTRFVSTLLNSWHQKAIYEDVSCILFETRCKHDTPPKLSTCTWFISNYQFLKGTASRMKLWNEILKKIKIAKCDFLHSLGYQSEPIKREWVTWQLDKKWLETRGKLHQCSGRVKWMDTYLFMQSPKVMLLGKHKPVPSSTFSTSITSVLIRPLNT